MCGYIQVSASPAIQLVVTPDVVQPHLGQQDLLYSPEISPISSAATSPSHSPHVLIPIVPGFKNMAVLRDVHLEDVASSAELRSPSPVSVASGKASTPLVPTQLVSLPSFGATFPARQRPGSSGAGVLPQLLLCQIAEKYGLAGSLPGNPCSASVELGRPSAAQEPDRPLLSAGLAADLMVSLNSHLVLPKLDSVPSGFEQVLTNARRREYPLPPQISVPCPCAGTVPGWTSWLHV